jgi:hypothetical protein
MTDISGTPAAGDRAASGRSGGGAPDRQAVWNYPEHVGEASAAVIGFDVECVDGHIGKIDAASADTDSAHLVVDTGWWIFGKKRLIPAGAVDRIDVHEEKVWIKLTKEQVKDAPDWNGVTHDDDPMFHDVYDTYYGPIWFW